MLPSAAVPIVGCRPPPRTKCMYVRSMYSPRSYNPDNGEEENRAGWRLKGDMIRQ